jgi:hypothetical protein
MICAQRPDAQNTRPPLEAKPPLEAIRLPCFFYQKSIGIRVSLHGIHTPLEVLMTTTTSRRAILAGAAVLPALTIPAIADDQDAELWHHADAIIRLWPEHERLRAIENDAGDRLYKVINERAGITPEMSGEESETRFSAALKSLDRETGHSEKCRAFEAVADRVHDHVSAIEKISTRSISGLAAKAIAAGVAIMGAWDKPIADLDWPDHQMRLLIEVTITAAGVANPFAGAGKAAQS